VTDFPDTIYTKGEFGRLAYQIIGEGPVDLVFSTSPIHNIDVMWEHPPIARFFNRLASFSRLIVYNPRGTGTSSALPPRFSLQEWVDDLRRVLDAAGAERAAVIGDNEGGPTAMLFAATYPQRASALVLVNTFARFLRDDDYPWGMPAESARRLAAMFGDTFGTGDQLEYLAPSAVTDPGIRRWYARYQRLSGSSPDAAAAGYLQFLLDLDLRPILPSIQAPALVLHRAANRFHRVLHGRYLGETIPGAKYVELEGEDALYFTGDPDAITDEIRLFLTGVRDAPVTDRVLATVLFTDIVGSTERAVEIGDRRWRELLEAFYAVARVELGRFQGGEVKTTGDGLLARFDGPARAIHCARAINDNAHRLGIDLRTGLHTGECEVIGDDLGGIAVHIGARVAGLARAGEVLVSRTVTDLVAGSGIQFEDRGDHELKGVPGEWRLYSVKG
jgi:class 3 adenylate cyclase